MIMWSRVAIRFFSVSKRQTHPFYQSLGKRYFCFAWDEGRDIIAQSGKQEVSDVKEADFILCTGAALGDLHAYMPALDIALKRGLPMICANPDLVAVDEKGEIKMCPGTIAKAYEDQVVSLLAWKTA